MAPSLSSVLAAGLLAGSSMVAAQQCTKYNVQATNNTYHSFNYYSFLDFRTGKADLTSQYMRSDYPKAAPADVPEGYAQTFVPSNVYVQDQTSDADFNATQGQSMLSLITQGTGHTSAELESRLSNYKYASVRIGARVTGAPGACAGLFFYHDDDQETDIEILTREQTAGHPDAETGQASPATTAQIHLTNQPHNTLTTDLSFLLDDGLNALGQSNIAGTSAPQTGSWDTFNNYRIDWVPGLTLWRQNGQISRSETANTIETEASWMMNIWSDGTPSWSGTLASGEQAQMDILWIEMAFNLDGDDAPIAQNGIAPTDAGNCNLGAGDGTSTFADNLPSALQQRSEPQMIGKTAMKFTA